MHPSGGRYTLCDSTRHNHAMLARYHRRLHRECQYQLSDALVRGQQRGTHPAKHHTDSATDWAGARRGSLDLAPDCTRILVLIIHLGFAIVRDDHRLPIVDHRHRAD
jgi:hypothetical protein